MSMRKLEEVGKRLKELRKETPLQKVAAAVYITENSLIAYEAGKRMPRDEVKIRLADYYGVSVFNLFFTDEDKEENEMETNEYAISLIEMPEADFALRVTQHGMEPVLEDGDMAFILAQDEIDGFQNGDIGVVAEDGQSYVGYIYILDNRVILTRPNSPAKMFTLSETCYIIGKVIGFTRTFHNPAQTNDNTKEDENGEP